MGASPAHQCRNIPCGLVKRTKRVMSAKFAKVLLAITCISLLTTVSTFSRRIYLFYSRPVLPVPSEFARDKDKSSITKNERTTEMKREGWMDERTDGRTDERVGRWMDIFLLRGRTSLIDLLSRKYHFFV